jgi:hypothetical protein
MADSIRVSELAVLDAIIAMERDKLERKRKEVADSEAYIAKLQESKSELRSGSKTVSPSANGIQPSHTRGTKTANLSTAIVEILRGYGGAMKLNGIVARLEEMGFRAEGKQTLTSKAFNAMDRSREIFERKGKGVYALRT